MKTQMRVRTVLIPAASILSSIPNDPARSFTTQERQLMVLAVLDELTHVHFQTVPWDYSFRAPPNQGAAFNRLQVALPNVSPEILDNTIRRLKARLLPVLAQYAVTPDILDAADAERVLGTAPYAGVFDHGVKYDWWNKYLLVRWYRPTVNWQEMSVLTYYQKVVGSIERTNGDISATVAAGLGYGKLSTFLSGQYEIKIQ